MKKQNKGITLIALVITIIILLILAGISISALTGNGLLSKVKQAKNAHIKAEMKEQLIIAISELQLEKLGEATLDDITQEWAEKEIKNYENKIIDDGLISGKKIKMKKDGIEGTFLIDENLNIIEIENDGNINFFYEVGKRNGNNVEILIHIQDSENGLDRVKIVDQDDEIILEGTKEEISIDYEVEIGKEYKIVIISRSGEEKEETILIEKYYHKIIKELGEGIEIDNKAVKTAYNESYNAKLTTGKEYILESIFVKMGEDEIVVDETTGEINIENVTEDIKITATAKKLEIETTDVVVGVATDSTSSVEDNSQVMGTTLYINFSATLNGTACTIVGKEDGVSVPYPIISNGKYIFIVTGIYNEKIVTKEIEVYVNKYKAIGGFVSYDAGNWTEDEINEMKEIGRYSAGYNTFGGFTYISDTSNQDLVTSRNVDVYNKEISGWKVFSCKVKNDSNGDVIKNSDGSERLYVENIIHAGHSEVFSFTGDYDYTPLGEAYYSEFVLSCGKRYSDKYQDESFLGHRNLDVYKDAGLSLLGMINGVHFLDYDDVQNNPNAGDVLSTAAHYYLASAYNKSSLRVYNPTYNSFGYSSYARTFGLRPVIDMAEGVYIKSGAGTEDNPFILAKE